MKYVMIAALTCAVMVIARDHVHHNVSNSLPILWAWVWQDYSVARGDLVELCPPVSFDVQARERGYVESGPCPGGTIPFLKVVAAVEGDVVAIDMRGIHVNGRLLPNSKAKSHDHAGRPLAMQPFGVRVIPGGFVWLYATNVWSADSRYYGPVPANTIRYHARSLIASASLPDLR
jgi:conjugative transfer signal peptidase TraF